MGTSYDLTEQQTSTRWKEEQIEIAAAWQQLAVSQQRAIDALTGAVEGMGAVLSGAALYDAETGTQSVSEDMGEPILPPPSRSPFIGGD